MAINLQREQNLEKMFEAVLKEKFDRFSRKYDHQVVFEIWIKMLGSEGFRPHLKKVGWKIDMTLQEALERFDDYCLKVEREIRKREGESEQAQVDLPGLF